MLKPLSILLAASISVSAFSNNLTNNITGLGQAGTAAYQGPIYCINDVTPLEGGQTIDVSGSANVGGSLRFNGCDPATDPYLGYLQVEADGQYKINNYTPEPGEHVAFTNYQIDSNGKLTGNISYTPIADNADLGVPIRQNPTWQYVGVNLSGLEFSKWLDPTVIPNVSQEDEAAKYSDLKTVQDFVQAGMNTIRVPVRWAYLQPKGPGVGDIDSGYYDNYVKPLLESLTQAKINTIIDLHAYMRYSKIGVGVAGVPEGGSHPEGTPVTSQAAFVDIWDKIYKKIAADPKIDKNYIMLDLVNEPTELPDAEISNVLNFQVAAIKQLRTDGFSGPILVEGYGWTGLHSWNQNHNDTAFSAANLQGLGDIIINVHQYLDEDYSGTHNTCQPDLTTTGDSGYNLDAFVSYLKANHLKAMVTEFGVGVTGGASGQIDPSCGTALRNFMNYLKDNAYTQDKGYGFVGWTIWSAGHGWGNYNLTVTPTSPQMTVLKDYLS